MKIKKTLPSDFIAEKETTLEEILSLNVDLIVFKEGYVYDLVFFDFGQPAWRKILSSQVWELVAKGVCFTEKIKEWESSEVRLLEEKCYHLLKGPPLSKLRLVHKMNTNFGKEE